MASNLERTNQEYTEIKEARILAYLVYMLNKQKRQ